MVGTAAAVTATAYFAGEIVITATTPVPTGPGPSGGGGLGDDYLAALPAVAAAAAAACDDTPTNCNSHYNRCLLSPMGARPGGRHGHSRCQDCREKCRRTGGWPTQTWDGKSCNYGSKW